MVVTQRNAVNYSACMVVLASRLGRPVFRPLRFFFACPDCFALLAAFHSVRREADVFRAIAFL